MTVEQIRECGKLIDIVNPTYTSTWLEYWQIHNIVYIINRFDNKLVDWYKKE